MKFSCFTSVLASLLLTAPSVLADGTDLGGGIVTRTDVGYLADLTLDVRDMADILTDNADGIEAALAIYAEGKNSRIAVGTKYQLTKLSTELSTRGLAGATPPYLFHLYGLAARDTTTMESHLAYADNFVRSYISSGKLTAGKAALVLNMWMYAADKLFVGLNTCQKMVEADNPSQFTLGTAGFDEFIALWIGTGSSPGSSDGESLYALTEESYDLFGGTEDEDPVNTKIKTLYQEASSHLSIPDVCTSTHPESPRKLWSIATQIISLMQVPMLRMLIHSVVQEHSANTLLFATAVVPQAAQCRPSSYKRLKEFAVLENPRFDKAETILRDLQDIYACFGLSCQDIGDISDSNGVSIPECIAADARAPLAEYKPTSDVHSVSRIDLDILQLRILTSMGFFSYAKLWYLYGRNSPVEIVHENDPYAYYSLADLAVTSSRQNADPIYTAFVSYHNDNKYADTIIRNTLNGSGKWGTKSVAQRSAIITETAAFMVLYLHLIAQVKDAEDLCSGMDSDGEYDLTHPWDEVAALVIGCLEGTEEGGSSDTEDGQLIWALASRRAFQFQTENGQGYATVNSNFEDYLYAGKGEIDAVQCKTFATTADQIIAMTMVPLMQSVLRYAVLNAALDSTSESADLALGETYALALIPIMQLYDTSAASIVEENMVFQDGIQPTRDGSQAVADAIGSFAVSAGIRCGLLGSISGAEPCINNGGSSAPGLLLTSSSAWMAGAVSMIATLALLF